MKIGSDERGNVRVYILISQVLVSHPEAFLLFLFTTGRPLLFLVDESLGRRLAFDLPGTVGD